MPAILTYDIFNRLSDHLTKNMGLFFPIERQAELERGLIAAKGEFGCKSLDELSILLLENPFNKNQIEILSRYLTVGETYFFREKRIFEILERTVIPEIIANKNMQEKHLRVWSAGCCTGEEPYSIAMVLNNMSEKLADWKVTILGTDINPAFLKKAGTGVYSEWSFRESPPFYKQKYFEKKKNNEYILSPHIREKVEFTYLNLVEDTYPSLLNNTNGINLIFCRNVMMYFDEKTRFQIINKLYNSLVDGGYLIVSSTEIAQETFNKFKSINFTDAIIFQKNSEVGSFDFIQLADIVNTTHLISYSFSNDLVPPVKVIFEDTHEDNYEQKEKPEEDIIDKVRHLYSAGKFHAAMDILLPLTNPGSITNDIETVYMLLSKCNANLGDLHNAKLWCSLAIEENKLNAHSHFLYATILMEEGLDAEAVTSLRRALYADHNHILALFSLGNLLRRIGKNNEAQKTFNNALNVLSSFAPDSVIPESEGMTAARLNETIRSIISIEEK